MKRYDGQYLDEFSIEEEEVNAKLSMLNNNKKNGMADVSNEMYKYSNNAHLNQLLIKLLKQMISNDILPFNFNIAIIKPIIKDSKKSTSDIGNIRPISVSDTLANIFESVLLDR